MCACPPCGAALHADQQRRASVEPPFREHRRRHRYGRHIIHVLQLPLMRVLVPGPRALRVPRFPAPPARRALASNTKQPAELGEAIKLLMRGSAQPVAVIAAFMPSKSDGVRYMHAATLSSFTTVSLAPPLVAFSLRLPSRLADALRAGVMEHQVISPSVSAAAPVEHPHFLIHLLSDTQCSVSDYFASPGAGLLAAGKPGPPGHPFVEHASTPSSAVDGMRVLDDSLGTFACSLVSQIDLTSPDLHGTMFTSAEDGKHAEEKGSALFIARIHAIEHADGQGSTVAKLQHGRRPLVYCHRKYGSVTLP